MKLGRCRGGSSLYQCSARIFDTKLYSSHVQYWSIVTTYREDKPSMSHRERVSRSDFGDVCLWLTCVAEISTKMIDLEKGMGSSIGISEEEEKDEERERDACLLNDRPHLDVSQSVLTSIDELCSIQSFSANLLSIGEQGSCLRTEKNSTDFYRQEEEQTSDEWRYASSCAKPRLSSLRYSVASRSLE